MLVTSNHAVNGNVKNQSMICKRRLYPSILDISECRNFPTKTKDLDCKLPFKVVSVAHGSSKELEKSLEAVRLGTTRPLRGAQPPAPPRARGPKTGRGERRGGPPDIPAAPLARKRPARARLPILPQRCAAVLSATAGLTSEFGTGSGDPRLHGRARAGRSQKEMPGTMAAACAPSRAAARPLC